MPVFSTPGPVVLDLELSSGLVLIETADTDETVVEIEPRGDGEAAREAAAAARVGQRQRADGIEVFAHVRPARRALGIWREPEIEIRVRSPHGADAVVRSRSADLLVRGRLGDLRFESASGELRADELGSANVTTASGDVLVDAVSGTASVKTQSGDITLGRVHGDAEINAVSGDLDLRDARGSVRVSSVSGDVQCAAVERGRVDLRAVSGDLHVGVRQGSVLKVDATTVSGDLESEVELDAAPSDGADGPLVDLRARTVSGDLRIVRAPARPGESRAGVT